MKLIGNARKFKQDNDINTDYIISGRYKFKIQDPKELAKHVMEDIDPNFYNRREDGDFIVAGKNFGCGSSREQAPMAIKFAGISAVIAKSFARIFYRNAFNIGLPLVECDTSIIKDGDKIELDLDSGILRNVTKEIEVKINPLPKGMQILLKDGGLVEHFKKHGTFKLD
ncbi:MAG: 3-isopropylmalate dehydratase small subunit [Candidatus Firestonebacteria bacterium]|nr:3-isopropylmalate dehydratase small subunit [Candidatus Firestonebacteria bacterium]